ncbi:MAG: TadE/TadG family type IV pilus assembly protein [Candidatus Methylacidiphilales bacterium]|nr:TadE/TadG family type IV pilus assembly protein [Candidatus Methylacidiphilales bacterium]
MNLKTEMVSLSPGARHPHRRGQALIEFVVVAVPVMMVLVFGAIELGILIGSLNRMAAADREGARMYMRWSIDATATGASSEIQTKVVTPMMSSVVQSGESSSIYQVVVSSLIRLDGPNRSTHTANSTTDDVIIIDKQFYYSGGNASSGSYSRIGAVDTVLAQNLPNGNPDTSKLLTIDYLAAGEKSVCVEIFRTYTTVTPLGKIVSGLIPGTLYDRCFF